MGCFELCWVPVMSTPLSPIETFWALMKHYYKCRNYSVTYETAGDGPRDIKAELRQLLKEFATPGEPLVSTYQLT